jgi:hypothetical protein
MRSRSYFKETIIGAGILFGGFVMFVGLQFMLPNRRPGRYRSVDWHQYDRSGIAGQWLIGAGATICLLSLAAGLFFAFTAPKFLAKTFRGVTIEDRIATESDGSHVPDDTAAHDSTIKCFLRLRTTEGDVIEAQCSRKMFCSLAEGSVGDATVSNQRLLSFVKTGARQNYS